MEGINEFVSRMTSLNKKANKNGYTNRSSYVKELYDNRLLTELEYKSYWELTKKLNQINYHSGIVNISGEDISLLAHLASLK